MIYSSSIIPRLFAFATQESVTSKISEEVDELSPAAKQAQIFAQAYEARSIDTHGFVIHSQNEKLYSEAINSSVISSIKSPFLINLKIADSSLVGNLIEAISFELLTADSVNAALLVREDDYMKVLFLEKYEIDIAAIESAKAELNDHNDLTISFKDQESFAEGFMQIVSDNIELEDKTLSRRSGDTTLFINPDGNRQ